MDLGVGQRSPTNFTEVIMIRKKLFAFLVLSLTYGLISGLMIPDFMAAKAVPITILAIVIAGRRHLKFR